jgi:hypothetical protein
MQIPLAGAVDSGKQSLLLRLNRNPMLVSLPSLHVTLVVTYRLLHSERAEGRKQVLLENIDLRAE